MSDDSKLAGQLFDVPMDEPAVPMRGYRIRQENGRQWIRDPHGIWLISEEDIVRTARWEGANPEAEGEPVVLFVRDGADILEIKRYRIERQGRPITVGDPLSPRTVEGEELMRQLSANLVRHLGVLPGASGAVALTMMRTTSTCCWGDGDWGIVCEDDDCGYS